MAYRPPNDRDTYAKRRLNRPTAPNNGRGRPSRLWNACEAFSRWLWGTYAVPRRTRDIAGWEVALTIVAAMGLLVVLGSRP